MGAINGTLIGAEMAEAMKKVTKLDVNGTLTCLYVFLGTGCEYILSCFPSLNMKGHHYRYLAEFRVGDDCEGVADQSLMLMSLCGKRYTKAIQPEIGFHVDAAAAAAILQAATRGIKNSSSWKVCYSIISFFSID
ncbi:hypothetical protein CCACVL1_02690 [Corchorus capsularis]|uniref:Uncharacterized protein n=1 Tax=Corchorus capsularis TaxID=210143 RepID=A0A1R3K6R7_COCAP|nr:hypothetical protein CCACVL1_02690 [Corchorus capsularis]